MSEISVMSQVLNEQIANMKRSIDKFSKVCSKVIEEFGTYTNETGNEVTADTDTISRKQAIGPFMDNSDDWVSYDVRKILESLPPSPTPNAQKALDDNSQHVQNVECVGDDSVSRQAVRDAVCEELDSIDHVPQWVFDRLTKKIENLPPSPSRPKEPQWIPCSDPSEFPKDKMLWVTHDNGYERYVEVLFWDMTEWSDKVSDVVAYMPYYEPEPYKGVDA